MATLDDMLTAVKNAVIAINNLNQTWLQYSNSNVGENTSAAYTDNTLAFTGNGTLVKISVINPGTTQGNIYDSSSTSVTPSSTAIAAIPNTIGVYVIGISFNHGLVVTPGTGQLVAVTYYVR